MGASLAACFFFAGLPFLAFLLSVDEAGLFLTFLLGVVGPDDGLLLSSWDDGGVTLVATRFARAIVGLNLLPLLEKVAAGGTQAAAVLLGVVVAMAAVIQATAAVAFFLGLFRSCGVEAKYGLTTTAARSSSPTLSALEAAALVPLQEEEGVMVPNL